MLSNGVNRGNGFNSAATVFIALMLCLCIVLLFVTNWRLKEVRHIQAQVANAETLAFISKQLALRRGLRAIRGEGNEKVDQELNFIDQVLDERILLASRIYEGDRAMLDLLNRVKDLLHRPPMSNSANTQADFVAHTEIIGALLARLKNYRVDSLPVLATEELGGLRYVVYDSARYYELLGQMRGAVSAYLVNYDPSWAVVARSKIEQVRQESTAYQQRLYYLADSFTDIQSQLRRLEDGVVSSEAEVLSELDRVMTLNSRHESVDLFYMVTQFMGLTGFIKDVFSKEFERRLEVVSGRYYMDMSVLITLLVLLISAKIALYTRQIKQDQANIARVNTDLSMFKSALDQHAIVSITDRDGVITYVNKKFIEVSGYSEDELLGQSQRLVNSGYHPGVFFKGLWDTIHEGRVWSAEICNRRKSGELYWVYATVSPSFDEHGQLASIISVRTDITEQKEIERQLHEEKAKADRANRAKSQFLANMSHEIRTPMNAVIGLTHLALRDIAEPKFKEYLEKIDLSAKHLLTIINDILDLSKIEAGKLDIETGVLDLHKLVSDVVQVSSVRASEKSLSLRMDWDDNIPPLLLGDAVRVNQVLTNLISNAVKFTQEGEVRVSVRVGDDREQGLIKVFFYVVDTGVGIAPEQVARLFQPFSQADESTTRVFGGTGLGLSICKQLVEMMGGEIHLHSAEGQGSCFYFFLPFELAVMDETSASSLEEGDRLNLEAGKRLAADPQAKAMLFKGRRVLIAEDNEINRKVITGLLAPYLLDITLVDNGAAALDAIQSGDFDLVLTDIQMPVMDGMELSRRVQMMDPVPKVPMVAMTAHAMAEDIRQCREAGMVDHLAKPISPERLLTVLLRWLPDADQAEPVQDAVKEMTNGADKPESSENVIDLRSTLVMVGGDKDLLACALQMYVDSYQDFTLETECCESESDRRDLHEVKGIAGTLGMKGLAKLATELDRKLKQGQGLEKREVEELVGGVKVALEEAKRLLVSLDDALREAQIDTEMSSGIVPAFLDSKG